MADNVIILAGGQGKRMKSDKPKALCKVLGEPMLEWVISACEQAGISDICVVKGFMGEYIDEYLSARQGAASIVTVEQKERLGTGHAVMQAADYLRARNGGNTLVLCGDAPFIDRDTIAGALELHKAGSCGVTVVTSKIDDPTGIHRPDIDEHIFILSHPVHRLHQRRQDLSIDLRQIMVQHWYAKSVKIPIREQMCPQRDLLPRFQLIKQPLQIATLAVSNVLSGTIQRC